MVEVDDLVGFSPRNGEVILRLGPHGRSVRSIWFQSPQWGSNSKDLTQVFNILCLLLFQSPQWGSNSKVSGHLSGNVTNRFQSPQWGSNSKAGKNLVKNLILKFQSPQWGSNSKVWSYARRFYGFTFQSPQWGSNSKGHPLETA